MKNNIMQDFGVFLRTFRRQKGFQVKQLAYQTDIPYEILKTADAGERILSRTEILAIAYVLEIPKEKLNCFFKQTDDFMSEETEVSNLTKGEFQKQLAFKINEACECRKIENTDLVNMLSISLVDAVKLRVGLIPVKDEWIEILSKELKIPYHEFEY